MSTISFLSTFRKVSVIILIVLFLSNSIASAANVRVTDGDTLMLEGVKIRLWGIDAPEMKQRCQKDGQSYACGQAAKIALESFIGTKGDVQCQVLDVDRYKRKVARCTVDGADLGNMMVRLGYALEYRQYSKGFYSASQAEAMSSSRGLWSMEFQKPWDWRRAHR